MQRTFSQATWVFAVWLFIFLPLVFGPWGGDETWGLASEPKGEDTQSPQVSDELYEEARHLGEEIRELRSKTHQLKNNEESLARELRILGGEIEIARLGLAETELQYEAQKERVHEKEQELAVIAFELRNKQTVLGELVRSLWRDYDEGALEIILAKDTFSDLFNELYHLGILQRDAQNLLGEVLEVKQIKSGELQNLERERAGVLRQKELSLLANFVLEEKIKVREKLLIETRGSEVRYQKLLHESHARLREIHKDLYEFSTLGFSIPLEELVREVERASEHTGVRPNLLLAILKVESNFGRNVGRGNWKADMHPRDWEAFSEITLSLGLDPEITPVSARPEYGWGGAMGPLQFLPSTWLGYREEVMEITGHNPPSPWNLEDALTAAGLKLAHAGAATRIYEDEWRSAMVYFAGDNWNNPSFSFYGDTVMDFASVFEGEFEE